MDGDPSLGSIFCLPDGYEKTAALAEWFQSLYPPDAQRPVLVGGAAVEILSGGAYTSGDLDFVGEVPSDVARRLEAAGFSRQGRHWIHEEGQVFFELPAAALQPPEKALRVKVGSHTVLILSPEDVLVDRLAAWEFWRSPLDGVAAFWIWKSFAGRLNIERLESAAEHRRVRTALTRLRDFAGTLGEREPSSEELLSWAETMS